MQRVLRDARRGYCASQWFAEQGFAVLVADGRGTPGRGPRWEREIYGDLAGPVLDDQVDGAARGRRGMPRPGPRAGSGSAAGRSAATSRRWRCCAARTSSTPRVAGAPVTDQRLYDTHWRERYLGHPDEHPEALRPRAPSSPTRRSLTPAAAPGPRPGRRQRGRRAHPAPVRGTTGRRPPARGAPVAQRNPHGHRRGGRREPPPAPTRLPPPLAPLARPLWIRRFRGSGLSTRFSGRRRGRRRGRT